MQAAYKRFRLCILDANAVQENAFGDQSSYRAKVKAVFYTKQEYKKSFTPKSNSFLDLHAYLQDLFAHLGCYAVSYNGAFTKQYVYSTWQELNTKLDPCQHTTIVSIDGNKTLVGSISNLYKNTAKAELCAEPNERVFSSLEKLFAFWKNK